MLSKLLAVAVVAVLASVATAATFDVTSPAEFQAALNMAQANDDNDTVNVDDGTYDIAASGTLTYTAVSTENFGLTIQSTSADSDLVTLDGGMQVPILRIDTTAVTSDSGIFVDIRNMTFQNGNAVGTPDDGGAIAILIDDSNQPANFAISVLISSSEFYDNAADDDGGAVFIRGKIVEGLVLFDLAFDRNQAGGDGGAAYIAGDVFSTPVFLSDIEFSNSMAQGNGGALVVEGFDAATAGEDRVNSASLSRITFYNNQSMSTSGGGGGADISALLSNIERVGFIDNQAQTGGGLRIRPNFSSINMVNSGFTGNTAGDDGGGMAAGESIFANVTITNNSFYENTATNRGGGVFLAIDGSSSFASFYNNIIYGNVAQQGAGDDLFVDNNAINDIAAIVEVFNNDVTDFVVTPGPVSEGANIDQDPLFVDTALRPLPDPRLMPGSPAIEAGDNNAPAAPNIDFEDDARPLDANGAPGGTIDIGMDEFSGMAVQNADLAVTKSDSPDPVTEGGNISYTVTVTNNGPGPATGVTLVDTLDGLVSFTSATPSQGTCTENTGIITCDIGNLANNASATVTIIVATPDVPDTTLISNVAGVSGAEPDPVSTNDSVTEQTTIVPAGPATADLAVTKSDSPDPVFSGGPQLTYSLTVTNNGPDAASNVVLTDTLPAGVTFVPAPASDDTCSEAGGVVTCDVGALALNASTTITIVVLPDEVATPTAITNNATVAATELDPTPGNNTVAETSTVNPPSADMSLGTTFVPESPLINEQITYSVTVSNTGPSDNTGVELTVVLPAMATFVSVAIDQGSCAVDTGTVTCTIGDMAASASVVAQIIVTAPDQATVLTLSATVTANVVDPTPGNNAISQEVSVIDVIDLVIEGTSEGNGSVGWIELLLLLMMAGVVAAKARGRQVLRVTLLPAIVGLVSAMSLVAPDDALAEGDWYIGAAVGQTNLDYSAADLTGDLASLGWSINNASVDDTSTAWKAYAGFQFNDWFALEAGYVDLGKVTTRFGASIPPNQIDALLNDTLSVHPYQGDGWIAAGVLKWPVVQDRFSLVGRAGLFAWKSKTDVRVISGGTGNVADDASGTDTMYGLGVEWNLNDQWALTADWERYKLNQWLDVPSIGVRFTF